MTIPELCKNLVEMNRFCSYAYDFVFSLKPVRKWMDNRIKEKITYLKTRKHMRFMIETTGICNAKCVFCPYPNMKRPHIPMSDEIFNKIVHRIKEEGIIPQVFDLFMIGEPFLDKKIFERIRTLKESFPNSRIQIISNFSVSDDAIVKQIVESDIDFINVSLNAANSKRYKEIMGLNYEKTVANINNLIAQKKQRKKKLKVCVSMVIYNNEKLRDVIKFLFQWAFKADSVRLQRAVTWTNTVSVFNLLGKRSTRVMYPCEDLFDRMPILSNGDFALCCQDAEGMIHKNILTDPIWETWQSEAYNRIREIHLSDSLKDFKTCKDCFGTNTCRVHWLKRNV